MLGLGPGALAYVVFFWVLRTVGSIRSSAYSYLTPAVGAVVSWLALGESVRLTAVVGLLLVMGGSALVSGPVRRPQPLARVAAAGEPLGSNGVQS